MEDFSPGQNWPKLGSFGTWASKGGDFTAKDTSLHGSNLRQNLLRCDLQVGWEK